MRVGRGVSLHLPGGAVEQERDVSFHSVSSSAAPSTPKPSSQKTRRIRLRRKTTIIGTGQRIPSLYLLEWSPGGKWYPINYNDVVPRFLSDGAYIDSFRDAKNRVLAGETVEVTAEYVPERKILIIKEA